MTEEKLKEMLQNRYRDTKSYWSLAPVDSKYAEMVIDVMKDVYNQGVSDAINNAKLIDKKIEYDGVRAGGYHIERVIDEDSILKLLMS